MMKCPYCNTSIHIDYKCDIYDDPNNSEFLNEKGISINHAFCPECKQLIISLQKGTIKHTYSYDGDFKEITVIESDEIIYPKYPCGVALDSAVPEKYRKLFKESEQVNNVSPRASATLSRFLLQMLLHEELNIQEANLVTEIQKLEEETNIPSNLVAMLQVFRRIANFGAHPKKSTNSAEITDIEKGESDVMLQLILELFDYVFVKPKKKQTFLQDIKEKYNIDYNAK